jgi:uncharacterized protein (DUF2267 family)
MPASGLASFDKTVQKTNSWLKDLMNILGWQDRQKAYRAFKATLHALRDRLTIEEAAELAAQFPMLMRGFYYEGWDPTGKPLKERHKEQFLARIERELTGEEGIDAEEIARAVFGVLQKRISEGEIEDVEHLLPADIRELWGTKARGAASGR